MGDATNPPYDLLYLRTAKTLGAQYEYTPGRY